MSPATKADFDYMFEGANLNPFKVDTHEWREYEQAFDRHTVRELQSEQNDLARMSEYEKGLMAGLIE